MQDDELIVLTEISDCWPSIIHGFVGHDHVTTHDMYCIMFPMALSASTPNALVQGVNGITIQIFG